MDQPVDLIVPPTHRKELHQMLKQIRTGERIRHFETVRRRKDGTLIDVSITVSPIVMASGLVVGASAIARDITARKRLAVAGKTPNPTFHYPAKTSDAQIQAPMNWAIQ